MTDAGSGVALVSSVTYDGATGQVLSMAGVGWSESRQYNVMGQMTRLTASGSGGSLDIGYEFPGAGANNGKLAFQQDYVSGERVQHLYDSLQRLQKSETVQVGGTQWGQQFGYDGFSNLVSKTVTKGSAPAMSINVDPATNRVVGGVYDANGNETGAGVRGFDVMNRMVWANGGTAEYEYDHVNKRISRVQLNGPPPVGQVTAEEFYFFGATAMMGRYTLTVTGAGGANPSMAFVAVETNHWFGGKLVQKSVYGALGSITSTSVLQDRMGSVGKYHPYGEEIGTPTANDREKFATYTRDSATGLDYADQRWHGPGSGRFLSADPYQASGGAGDPGSWNRYGYVGGDPANHNDPSGLDRYVVDQHAGLLCSVRIDHEGNRTTIGCVLTPVALGQLRDDFEQKGPGLISAYGDCNKSGTQREEDYLSRLANNYLPAIQAADQSGLPVSWVLGWAQSESGGFTLNAIASSNGNFFSQTVTQAGTTGGIDGAVACSAGTVLSSIFDGQTRHWACFPGFLESALAALLRPLGGPGSGYILPAGTTNAAQVILAGAGGANGNAAVGFQLLANSGYDRGNPGYGQGVAAAIGYVSKRLDCLRGIGAIR